MTTKLRTLALGAFLSVSALSAFTLTSCNKEDEPMTCNVGYTGNDCKTEVRTSYYNSYKGTGTDNKGKTYSDWTAKFTSLGTDVTKMNLQLLDGDLNSVRVLTVTLTTNEAFNIDQKTTSDGYTYSGTGTINANSCSITLVEKDGAVLVNTVTYTFNNMVKQ